jgi:hypothetical protein
MIDLLETLVAVMSAHYTIELTRRGNILLNKADQTLLLRQLRQPLVVLELLSSRLGDQHVMAQVERFSGDGEMGRVGSEDDDGRTLGEGAQSILVCIVSTRDLISGKASA